MLPYGADLGVVLYGVQRVSILKRVPIGVVHKDVAIGHIMHEQAPEEIACYNRFGLVLLRFDDAVERRKGRRSLDVTRPIILTSQICLVSTGDKSNVGL